MGRQRTKGDGGSQELRKRAEDRLEHRRAAPADGEQDPRRLLHELEVRQVELEIQNEELLGARKNLEESLQRYTQIFDRAPFGYVVLDRDASVRAANVAAVRMLGADGRPVVNRSFTDWLLPDDRTEFTRFLARTMASRPDTGGSPCELSILCKGALARDVRLTGAPTEGESPGALVTLEDVTARKRAEASVRQEAGRKDAFLSVLSHELRDPLAPIRNGLRVLDRVERDTDAGRSARAIIDRQFGQLTRIVEDLLDIARIANGKVDLRRQRLELSELVRHTVEDHRPAFDVRGIRLTADLRQLWVDVDPTRLAQALGILLGNAVKFTNRGGLVEVTMEARDDRAVLSVRDNGIGIAADVRAQLFQAFSQAPQTIDRRSGGLGLGLATVKGLIELHGGAVAVESAGPNRGSTFSVSLPIVPPVSAHLVEASASPRAARRVLVVDDNVDMAESLQCVLELEGHVVHVRHNAPTGIAEALEFRPDVVICDIGLPGMSGYDFARALRAFEELKGVYLVALTGYAGPKDVESAFEAGYAAHLAKPPDLERLERLVLDAPRAPITRGASGARRAGQGQGSAP
jgi:PAS domain S-box-containing protein